MQIFDKAAQQTRLQLRRAELVRRLRGIEAELESHQSKDWEERATEREGDEVFEAMGQSGVAEIAQIDASLARFEAGSYGICVKCDEDISEERLNVLPYTPVCKSCATRAQA